MKIKFIIFLVITAAFTAYCSCNSSHVKETGAEQSDSSDVAVLSFSEYEHDFGKVAEGEKISYIFKFTNAGSGPLVIASAVTSCGCTVPKYDDKPIPPGISGDLEVVFDTSGRNGMQTKTVSVRSNASVPIVLIKITAEVVAAN